MRSGQVELDISQPTVDPNTGRKRRFSLPTRLREIVSPESAFTETLTKGEGKTGFTVQVFLASDSTEPTRALFIPPRSRAAGEFTEKVRRFVTARIPLKSERGALINPSDQRNGEYALWINPDYTATEEGFPGNINDLRIDFMARNALKEDEVKQLADATKLLNRFSQVKDTDYPAFAQLVNWELENRATLASIDWKIDEEGRSTGAIVEPSVEIGEEVEARKIWTSLALISTELKRLEKTLRGYDNLLDNEDLPPESKDLDSEHIRKSIQHRASTIEAHLKDLFQFLPLAEAIFSQGELSFIDPYAVSSEELTGICRRDMQEVQKFIEWMQQSILDSLFQKKLNLESEKQQRLKTYSALAPHSSNDSSEVYKSWMMLEENFQRLQELERMFPEIPLEDILVNYAGLLIIHRLRVQGNWMNARYSLIRTSQEMPNFVKKNEAVFSAALQVAEGYIPTAVGKQGVTKEEIMKVCEELALFKNEGAEIVKILKTFGEFVPALAAMADARYNELPSSLRKEIIGAVEKSKIDLSNLVIHFKESTPVATGSVQEPKSAAQKVVAIFRTIADNFSQLESSIKYRLETPAEQT